MPEEKIYTSMYSRNAELYHHGIKGQKWGVENGPPYPLSSDVSTGKRLKKVEKLEKKIEQNRGYMKEHEDYYKNKADREAAMKKNDRDQKVKKTIDNTVRKIEKANKKIEKANEKFEKQSSRIEKHNERQLENSPGRKLAKEDALKAEIKIKKLLAKENGGKYRYKDMTDEEKAYYKKNAQKKITNALVISMALLYTANELGLITAPRPNEIKEYSSMKKSERNVDKAYKKFDKSVKNGSYYTDSKTREKVNSDVDKAINEREKKRKEFEDKHHYRKFYGN